jgi:hypothetical protein
MIGAKTHRNGPALEEVQVVDQALAVVMQTGLSRARWGRSRRRQARPLPSDVSVAPGAPLSVAAPAKVLEAIAQEYGLTAAHWGRSGTDAGVWGVDQHGWVTFVEVSASLPRQRALGSPLALVGEESGHGDPGVDAGARVAEAVGAR